MVDNADTFHRLSPRREPTHSESRAVAHDLDRRRAIRAKLMRDVASRRPGSPLKHFCEWKFNSTHVDFSTHARAKFVDQGQGEVAPFNNQGRAHIVLTSREV